MEMTYDAEVDAAYLTLVEEIHDGEVGSTERLQAAAEIYADFDAQGRLLGFEILSASQVLRDEVLEKARRI